MKIGLNDAYCNDPSAFDAGDDRFVVPNNGTYLLGATFLYKRQHIGADEWADYSERHDRNLRLAGRDQRCACLRGDSALVADDDGAHRPVELQGNFSAADGYFGLGHASF